MYPDQVLPLLAVSMLIGATVADWRTRRVRNRYWWPWLGAAILSDALLILDDSSRWLSLALAAGACALFYLMWRLRLFGGADAKGLMVLSLLLPVAEAAPRTVPAFDILLNGLLVALAMPLLLTVYNLVRGDVSPVMMLGIKRPIEWAKGRFYWPLETVIDGRNRWVVFGRSTDPWTPLEAAERVEAWVTPKLPFMAFPLVGLFLFLKWGNIVLRVLNSMSGLS